MAKTNEKCRLCRREGAKLFLKGVRCSNGKCPIDKKGAVPPGMHGAKGHRRSSEYGNQLRAKQKAKRMYGISEIQFKNYFANSRKAKGETGIVLLQNLESRLDNVLFKLGFAPNRNSARQIIGHGNIIVNGKKLDIPSYQVREKDVITLASNALQIAEIKACFENKEYEVPAWLDRKAIVGTLVRLPQREEIEADIDDQAIIEYYSR